MKTPLMLLLVALLSTMSLGQGSLPGHVTCPLDPDQSNAVSTAISSLAACYEGPAAAANHAAMTEAGADETCILAGCLGLIGCTVTCAKIKDAYDATIDLWIFSGSLSGSKLSELNNKKDNATPLNCHCTDG